MAVAIVSSPLGLTRSALPADQPKPQAAPRPQEKSSAPARTDLYGDPLPEGAIARMGTVRWRHDGGVSAIAASRDGKIIVTAGKDVRVWERATGQLLHRLPGLGVDVLAISPDDKILATGNGSGWPPARLWDLGSGKELCRPLKYQALLGFSKDGKTLITSAQPRQAPHGFSFWDVPTGNQRRHVPTAEALKPPLAASADGQTVAVASTDGRIQLWDTASGKEVRRLQGHKGKTTTLAFSADGKTLASGGDDKTVRLWETATGRQRVHWEGIETQNQHLAFSFDGSLLAGSGAGNLNLWQLATGNKRDGFRDLPYYTEAVAFLRDGTLVTTSAASPIKLWDAASGKCLNPDSAPQIGIRDVAFTPNGRALVTADLEGTVRFWETTTGQEQRKLALRSGRLRSFAFSPDGKRLAWGGMEDKDVHLWDAIQAREICRLKGHRLHVDALAFSLDGRILASAGMGDPVRLWDTASGKEIRSLGGPHWQSHGPGGLRWVSFSPDGKALAAEQAGGPIVVWDLVTGSSKPAPDSSYGPLDFSSSGPTLAFRLGRVVVRWDFIAGKEAGRCKANYQVGHSLAFSPDARTLAIAEVWNPAAVAAARNDLTGFLDLELKELPDSPITLCEALTGQQRRQFVGHSWINNVTWSRDGKLLASAGGDGTALVWDITAAQRSGQPISEQFSATELESLWADLADDDAARAYQAVCKLIHAPATAVRFLNDRLRPSASPESQRIARLIADLDADDFRVREKANTELAKLGRVAAFCLRRALAESPSAEVRRRLEQLLAKPELRNHTGLLPQG